MEKEHDDQKGRTLVGSTIATTMVAGNYDGNNSDEKKFRSVLPHEPLPIGNSSDIDSNKGYVHLQGAFEPKQRKAPSNGSGSASGSSSQQPASSNPKTSSSYWKSAEALEEALLLTLRDEHERLRLPFPALSVCVMDPNNLSRLRLEYRSPYEALQIQYAFRDQRISPQDILSSSFVTTIRDDNQSSGTTGSVSEDRPVFGGRACQATMITTNPLPGDTAAYWPRSNPPQFRRLLHDRGNDEHARSLTRFVYVTGLIDNSNNTDTTIPDWWHQSYAVLVSLRWVFGNDVEIFLPKRKKGQQQQIQSCHIGFRSAKDAQRSVRELQGKVLTWECGGDNVSAAEAGIQSGQLFLDYATITQKSKAKQKGEYEKGSGEASRPECTSSTAHMHVPGLVVVEDFLTEVEEQILMAVLTGPQAPWAPQQSNKSQTGAVKRLVQHYGYVFDYQTADVLRRDGEETTPGAANCPAMPVLDESNTANTDDLVREGRGWEVLAKIVEKTRQHTFEEEAAVSSSDEASSGNGGNCQDDPQKQQPTKNRTVFPDLNQMTLNHYKPGEGIGSHVDTCSAFGDGLISISLNSGIVMEFTKVATTNGADTDADADKASLARPKKLVYLPRRSLVLMSGPARFEWEHQIVTRRTDTHNGVVLPRGLRVSLTLRTALTLSGDPLPRFESSEFPPVWGVDEAERLRSKTNSGNSNNTNALVTPSTERDHVHAVYDAIATQWHHTRGKRGVLWPSATQFVQNLSEGSIVADVGCGDGKYFPAIWEAGSYVIGTDISLPLLLTSFDESSSATSIDPNVPDSRRVSPHRKALQKRPAVAVADCMSVPLRNDSCDAAICIAVMHHLSTIDRRIRCLEELSRIVKPNGRIHVQAWAMEQAADSKRRFAATDMFVPFNAQPKYLDKVSEDRDGSNTIQRHEQNESSNIGGKGDSAPAASNPSKSVAELYSEAYEKADFDERKGLVVFQRYCHMYREGELDDLVQQVSGVRLIESGYESGNHYVILEVVAK
jgi:alkylated DNA repair dioxygenase AlkB/SAM-dependent methyltransferase